MLALVWTDSGGDLRVQPFPPMKGLHPPAVPTRTRQEAFPDLPVGGEPACGDSAS